MTADATRAVLLARAGEARSRLQAALADAGADIVLTADPAETTPGAIGACNPQVVLVALEPAVEDALEAFEAYLADPALIVVYDEAELAAQREGWDSARWVRHLAAKLRRSEGVLPPGGESDDDFQPSPGALPRRDEPGPRALDVMAGEAVERAAGVPRGDELMGGDGPGPLPALSLGDLQLPEPGMGSSDFATAPAAGTGAVADAAMVAGGDDAAAVQEASNPFANLSLVVDDAPADGPGPSDGAATGAGSSRGAVVIEGGIGGPDAARQLLAALPIDLPRPVLVRLLLDGGRYDRLVTQMARASTMPVVLGQPGAVLQAGKVYFLPPGLGVSAADGGLVLASSDAPASSLHAELSAEDSAVILLSGSDPALVDTALAVAGAGALVAAQPVAECYEATAATDLLARGGEASDLAGLAARIAARWTH